MEIGGQVMNKQLLIELASLMTYMFSILMDRLATF
jgi:hypothetical protein